MAAARFGTDGIRGTAGQYPVDEQGAYELGLATAEVLGGQGRVFIGRDPRPSGQPLAAAVARGLTTGGLTCCDLGCLPTPGVGYFVMAEAGAAGIAVSASHNPASANGFKFFGPGGAKATDELQAAIEAAFGQARPAAAAGRLVSVPTATERYIEFCLSTLPAGVDLTGWSIAVDCANGAAGTTTPAALTALGATVTAMGHGFAGERINAACGSLHPEAVQALRQRSGAQLGVAHDGDGDRLLLVDEAGEVVDGDRILGLIARVCQDRGELAGNVVVGTILSNIGLEQWLGRRGLTLHRSDVGDRNVWRLMTECGAELGGEPSGHTILRRVSPTDDALLALLHVLAAAASTGRTVHELTSDIPLMPQHAVNLRVSSKPALESLPAVQHAIAGAREMLNGDGRLIVRYSGTEALARIMVEGPDAALLDRAVGLVRGGFQSSGLTS